MTTLAKRRGKINGFITEYEKRIKQYREKYPAGSIRCKVQVKGCLLKIKAWKEQIARLDQRYDPIKDMERAICFTKNYFGADPVGPIKPGGHGKGCLPNVVTEAGYGVENNKSKYFLAKFALENGVVQNNSTFLLEISPQACRDRRARAIVAMRKNKELSRVYKQYEKALQDFLAEKGSPKFLDPNQ